jgi:hypothetical protein
VSSVAAAGAGHEGALAVGFAVGFPGALDPEHAAGDLLVGDGAGHGGVDGGELGGQEGCRRGRRDGGGRGRPGGVDSAGAAAGEEGDAAEDGGQAE